MARKFEITLTRIIYEIYNPAPLIKMDLRILTFALSIFLVFDCGEAISCEVCNGHTQAECNDPYWREQQDGTKVKNPGEKFQTDCEDLEKTKGATMCRKIYQDGKR